MVTAAVTSKGQVTIPALVRTSLGIKAGSRIEFIKMIEGQYYIVPVNSPVSALKGMLKKPETPITIEQMNDVIAARGASTKQ